MGYKTFTDCVDLVGSACRPFIGTKKYISTGAVDTDHIVDADVEIVDFDGKPSRANLEVSAGDVLFAKMEGTKKTLKIDDALSNNVYSTGFCAVRAREGVLMSKCLYHLLTSRAFLDQKDKNCSGATQKAITNDGLKKVLIRVPEYSEQVGITGQLDALATIIEYRQKELKRLDDLIKARFVEMFGTVTHNQYGFKTQMLTEVSREFFAGGDKPSDCSDVQDEDHPYPVYANGFENSGLQGYSSVCRVRDNAVTVSARGTIGCCFIRDAGFTPVVRLITIVPKSEISVEYLKYAVDTLEIKSSGTSQAQLTVPDFKKEMIVVPPTHQQQFFSGFVAQIDKSKMVVQQALDKAQLLFDSLMQKYFG